MAKSSFCYQQQQLKKEDKFAELRKVIINIFDENKKRYGYRRIHIELKKIGWKISEKNCAPHYERRTFRSAHNKKKTIQFIHGRN